MMHFSLENIGFLSNRELGVLCSLFGQRIMPYLVDVFLDNRPVDQARMSRYLALLMRHMETMGKIWTANPDRKLSIKVEKLLLYITNTGVNSQMEIKLDWRHFQLMGPSAMIKLLDTVFYAALENFDAILSEPDDLLEAQRCRTQVDLIMHSLKSIFSQIPDKFDYLIKSSSDLYSIDFDLEIKYD
jgi:hypothetical protein